MNQRNYILSDIKFFFNIPFIHLVRDFIFFEREMCFIFKTLKIEN